MKNLFLSVTCMMIIITMFSSCSKKSGCYYSEIPALQTTTNADDMACSTTEHESCALYQSSSVNVWTVTKAAR